jgi:hydrogenase nickel incorporation protein HypA/HybF
MHEMSLSYATVESVLESVAELNPLRIRSLTLTVGELSGVSVEALRFSFPIAAAGTMLEDAELILESEPVQVYCGDCEQLTTLADLQSFCCSSCGKPTSEVRSGKDLLIRAIEVETNE